MQTYLDAKVSLPAQMKSTIARNYYRMNEGDDVDKPTDKFGDVEKLRDLLVLIK